MKKLFVITMTAFIAVGCTESSSSKEAKTTKEINRPSTTGEVNQREKEIRDSTKMLDEELNDTTK